MRKKIVICLLAFLSLLFLNKTFSQEINKNNIVGIWQVSTSRTGSALLAHYRFFGNGKFIYNFNAYDNTSRIRSAGGLYKLKGNYLQLYITYRTELSGGDLVQGAIGFQQEEMVLEGAKLIKVTQSTKDPIELTIQSCKTKNPIKCMKLQNNVYYKISKNPEEE